MKWKISPINPSTIDAERSSLEGKGEIGGKRKKKEERENFKMIILLKVEYKISFLYVEEFLFYL